MATTSQLRAWWRGYRCEPHKLQPVTLFGRNAGRIPPPTVDAYTALEQVLTATGYDPTSVWTYNCRKIGGTTSWSLHSYGIAVDIDPARNPYSPGDPFELGAFKPRHIEPVEAIRNVQGEQVWFWGGRWSRPDRMHFQINVPPTRCQIDWDTVTGGEYMETLQVGDSGWGVNRLQNALNNWIELHSPDKTPLTVDGSFGDATEERVIQFQNGSKLPDRYLRGVVGGITWGWLMEYIEDQVVTPAVPVVYDARIVPL